MYYFLYLKNYYYSDFHYVLIKTIRELMLVNRIFNNERNKSRRKIEMLTKYKIFKGI